jgi:hypothetical protein
VEIVPAGVLQLARIRKNLSLKEKTPVAIFCLLAGWVKPGMKKRLREHGSPQPFLHDRAILAQFSSQLLTLRLIGGQPSDVE